MSWLGLGDRRGWLAAPDPALMRGSEGEGLLLRGTLLVELRVPPARERPLFLLHYRRREKWLRALSLILYADGNVELTKTQGASSVLGDVAVALPAGEVTLRISYGWDAPAREGYLAVELPDHGVWARAPVADPHPVPLADLAAIVGASEHCAVGEAVELLAVSDRLEPIGPMPGLAGGTLIDTAAGPKPVEELARGDLVRTETGAFQPVRAVVSREVPFAGRHAPLAMAAPVLGLRQDVLVAPDHRMMIAGSHTEYLFGSEAVLVEARHLGRGTADVAPRRRGRLGMRYHQLVLDRHQCLSIAGAWGESLHVGRLTRSPAQLAGTILADVDAGALPLHDRHAGPMLLPFEAVELVAAIGS